MPYYVGLDASKRTTKVCVLDDRGAVVREGTVASDPKEIAGFLRGEGRRYARVGLESWSMASWLYVGLARAGLPIICIEARHAHAVLAASRANKTDRNDAKGIAEMMRAGIYKRVHIKTAESRQAKGLLTTRKLLRTKAIDLELGIGSALLLFGLKLHIRGGATFEHRVRKLIGANAHLSSLVEPLLRVRSLILKETAVLEQRIRQQAESDPVCRRLMTAPGVGWLTALAYRAAVDEPARFTRSRDVAAHFGLTPQTKQSGEMDRQIGISRHGDSAMRTALFHAARCQLRRDVKPSPLKEWGMAIATRRGGKKAIVAMARRLAVTLHRMWVTETDYRWTTGSA